MLVVLIEESVVGGKRVGEVEGMRLHLLRPYKSGLMAKGHLLLYVFQRLGTHLDGAEGEAQLGIAIDDTDLRRIFSSGEDIRQHLRVVKAIAGVHEVEPPARGEADAFVHGVVDTAVRLAQPAEGDAPATESGFPFLNQGKGAVCGGTIYHDIFNRLEGLRQDAVHRGAKARLGVAADRDDTDFGDMIHFFLLSSSS